MTRLHPTEVGRQIAMSGFLPETAHYLLNYLAQRHENLQAMVPRPDGDGGSPEQLNFCLVNACLTAPEFESRQRTRFIPFGFDDVQPNQLATLYRENLAEQVWQPYRAAANATGLLLEWAAGTNLALLEGRYQAVRAGNIQGLAKETAWCLSGLASILAATVRPGMSEDERPLPFRSFQESEMGNLRRLLPAIRLLIRQLCNGLPAAVLWLSELRSDSGKKIVTRNEAAALHHAGLSSFEDLRRRNNWEQVIQTLAGAGARQAHARAQTIQQCANAWHQTVRERARDRQIRRLDDDDHPLLNDLYDSREKHFESALERLLARAGIGFTLFDDNSKQGAFDYLIHIDDRPDFIIECKTKIGNGMVDLNAARVVLSSSEQFGYRSSFCVTLCQPGVDPNVPENLQSCDRLCLIETHDLAEAVVRVITGALSAQALHDWITQPGTAKADNLFQSSRSA